jgi:hypothetical protein
MKLSFGFFLATLLGARGACEEKAASATSVASLNANANLRGVSIGSSEERRLVIEQPGCYQPIKFGALRNWEDRSQCLNVEGTSGIGNVNNHICDIRPDQVWYLCEDGSIRNEASQFCLAETGRGNVGTTFCPDSPQKWEEINQVKEVDSISGIEQLRFQLKHEATGKCLDVDGGDGRGQVGLYDCSNDHDQYWHFRRTGGVVASGALKNKKSGSCMNVEGCDGFGDVNSHRCEENLDQIWTLYENGELINRQSGLCLDVSGSTGYGNIGTYYCLNKKDQMWEKLDKRDGLFTVRNKLSGRCVDVHGSDGRGAIQTYTCTNTDDQDWNLVPEEQALGLGGLVWGRAQGRWTELTCGEGISELSVAVTKSVTSSHEISEEFSVSVATAITASFDVGFGSVEASVSVETAKSFGTAWGTETTEEVTTTQVCDVTGGRACMYQFMIDLEDDEGGTFNWSTSNIACTDKRVPPPCAPFDVCGNEECSVCVPEL